MIERWSTKKIIILSLVIHVLISYFSTGFQHFDEQFQIFEFLGMKLGISDAKDLPWEFREQIRPWFQVWLYFLLIKPIQLLGIENPFFYAFICRLSGSLLGLFAISKLIPIIKNYIKDESIQKISFFFLNFAWFIPYIQARTNSENLGISMLIFGLVLYLDRDKIQSKPLFAIIAGLFLGLSFQARFQMAACVAPIWFWSVFIGRYKIKILAACSLGVLIGIFSGFLFDFWGYGNWNFSLWHYYRTNFVEGIMANVKHYPFYWYLRWGLLRGIPPVSLIFLIPTLWFWIKKWRNPLTWATLPLFLLHSAIGHKELRYLYPVIFFSPIFLGVMIEHYKSAIQERAWIKHIFKFSMAINFLILIIVTFRPANPAVDFYQYIWNSKIKEFYAVDESPLSMQGLPINFYRPKDLKISVVDEEHLPHSGKLFFNKGDQLIKMKERCELLYATYPSWAIKFNIGNWVGRSRVWSLFNCKE